MKKEVKKGIVSEFIIDEVGKGEKWFQFERMGFFYLDESSEVVLENGKVCMKKSNIVFNNVVDLKISKERKKILENK